MKKGLSRVNTVFNLTFFSMRMLINQHTLLFEPDAETDGRQIGIIDPDCNVVGVIKTAFNNASFLCEEYYSISPEMNLQVKKTSDGRKFHHGNQNSSQIRFTTICHLANPSRFATPRLICNTCYSNFSKIQ